MPIELHGQPFVSPDTRRKDIDPRVLEIWDQLKGSEEIDVSSFSEFTRDHEAIVAAVFAPLYYREDTKIENPVADAVSVMFGDESRVNAWYDGIEWFVCVLHEEDQLVDSFDQWFFVFSRKVEELRDGEISDQTELSPEMDEYERDAFAGPITYFDRDFY